jgi:hypothetical protein
MNCANHPDRERVAFCQHCGKPLCSDCVRNVGTSVFCEPCLAARVAGTAPPHTAYPYPPAPGYTPPNYSSGYSSGYGYPPSGQPRVPGEPNPGLAALLGFIPGVGAMYNEQYAKGIVHLMVFAVLVSLASDVNGIFGLFIAGWVFYMAIEAYHTAKARRDGMPLPNPFGLNDLAERLGFGRAWPSGVPPASTDAPGQTAPPNPGAPPAGAYAPPYTYSYVPPVTQWAAPPDPATWAAPPMPPVPPMPPMPGQPDPSVPYYNRFPSAAIWLIGLGVLFLLSNIPVFHLFRGRLFVPIFFIGMGIWLFVRRMLDTGTGFENDGTAYYHWRLQRALRGSVWMVLIGVLWLLQALNILSFAHTWPLLLIAFGVMLFLKRTFYGYGHVPPPQPGATAPVAAATSTEIVPSNPDAPHDRSGNGQEGR